MPAIPAGGRKSKKICKEKKFMSKPGLVRSLVAIATIATLLSAAYRSSAAELNHLVVTVIALDRVASRHAAPGYPQDARSRRIQGDVRVRIQVEKGEMLNVTAESTVPVLAAYSSRWLRWHWQFRPSVSGVYLLPISYKLTA
jgi:Gram-negative bacterial TonB protein C-terminal